MPLLHEFVHANGIRFHYVTAGEGPLVVLLHGFPQCWYAWRHQIPVLAERFRVVAPDLRGYGGTDKPPRVSDYRLDVLARDVKELVLALGARDAFLVGHDWGAAVAWTVALEHPEVVRRLAILNVPEPRHFARELWRRPGQLLRSWYLFLFQIPWLPERLLAWRSRRLVEEAFRGWAIRKEAFTDEDLRVFEDAWKQPGALRGMIHYYRAAFRYASRFWKDDRRIPAPTLVLWGEEDRALSKGLTEGMDRWVSGPYRIRYVKRCSHWVNEERPELVNRELLDHFEAAIEAREAS